MVTNDVNWKAVILAILCEHDYDTYKSFNIETNIDGELQEEIDIRMQELIEIAQNVAYKE